MDLGPAPLLRTRWLGRLPYAEAWDLQKAFHEGKRTGRADDDWLLLVEHPPVYTVGRNGDGSNLLVPEQALVEAGAEYFHVDRGGDITYHGPGQITGYPIVGLSDPKKIVPYVRTMERALIAVLAEFGIEGWHEDGLTGVWTERGKVAAIGVRVSRGVTMHGFGLNVNTDLSWFQKMVPCGIADRPVTSISELVGREVVIEEVVEVLDRVWPEVFGYTTTESQFAAFVRGQGRRRDPYLVDELVASGTFSPHNHDEPVLFRGLLPGEPERPPWMRVTANLGADYVEMKALMRGLDLHTVCEEAGCPNIYECWSSGTATLMILGDTCTRACSFCNVNTGKPAGLDTEEPRRAAESIRAMGLRHAVITSVDRDDLPDGGAALWADTIRETRALNPDTDIETLVGDFKGDAAALQVVMEAGPDVLNHNTETVLRLQRDVRTAANYGRSLALLARARWMRPGVTTKSGLIVGVGERKDEVLGALADLNAVGVDIVTIGQYLRPTARHQAIDRYVHPDEFADYRAFGEGLGIGTVESGPLVRSSYHAAEAAATVS
jgi:lipoic acid synthetase